MLCSNIPGGRGMDAVSKKQQDGCKQELTMYRRHRRSALFASEYLQKV